ncbi:MAG: hypothetical protein ACXVDF_04050, partial [Ktedonobacterales bacterium]
MTTATTTSGKETHAKDGKDATKDAGNISGKNGKSGNIACPRPTRNLNSCTANAGRSGKNSGNFPAKIPAMTGLRP